MLIINQLDIQRQQTIPLSTTKSMKEEERVISCTNIILATPGRILHHLDKTYCFTLDNLQILGG